MADEKKTDAVELSGDAKKIAEMLEKMTVLELSELVKGLEDKFGVSASAPVAAVAAAPAAGAAEEEEKSNYDVILADAGSEKIKVIKAVKAASGLGLKEAKELVESAPKAVKEAMPKEEAEELKKTLEEAGATVELK